MESEPGVHSISNSHPLPVWYKPEWLTAITALLGVFITVPDKVSNYFSEEQRIAAAKQSSEISLIQTVMGIEPRERTFVLRYLSITADDDDAKNWAKKEVERLDKITELEAKLKGKETNKENILEWQHQIETLENQSGPATTPDVVGEKYSRSSFGGWVDVDSDCQNTRTETLISKSEIPVKFDSNGCKVISGRWKSAYSGKVITDPRLIDIDHIVPLKEAWNSGANTWPVFARVHFANDPNVLSISLRNENRIKGVSTPLSWLPEINKCDYINNWVDIKNRYQLKINNKVDALHSSCLEESDYEARQKILHSPNVDDDGCISITDENGEPELVCANY